ncbi:hypothetical protein SAMN05421846_10225 [Chryseobacterium taeanense]|uniref:Uncharacterized protein n=1 Tax=Chryseobacterium taeanense TaxID=311334 RepID=A0A1G8F744_9FLAO|nr:hypothetical protein SAMN05421846_10225 [Chryseobacterium taeanense]
MDVESNAEYINLPEILVGPFGVLCKSENLQLQIVDQFESNYDKMKVLIFGNDIVSPDNYCLNQPYIIAEKFTALENNS